MKKIFISVSSMILAACSFFESGHDDYWLNNVRSYKTVPINYYNSTDDAEKMTSSQTLNTRTYERNVVVSANLGQRMVDAQTYKVENFSSQKTVANGDGIVVSSDRMVSIKKGNEFVPLGEVKVNGEYYMIISASDDDDLLLIDSKGKFLDTIGFIYHGKLLIPREKATVIPNSLGIEQNTDVRENVTDPKLQFEIKYDGLENGQMAFIYTDYSNADSTEGYFNRFTFPVEKDLVNINGVKFKVMDVYPERIEYMLLD